MPTRKLSSVEKLYQTLVLRNPDQKGVLVGTGAIALHMAQIGHDISPIGDVDVVAEPEVVHSVLEHESFPAGRRSSDSTSRSVTVLPD